MEYAFQFLVTDDDSERSTDVVIHAYNACIALERLAQYMQSHGMYGFNSIQLIASRKI
jgi:hypothetical protein